MTVLNKSLLFFIFLITIVSEAQAQWVRSAKSQAYSRTNAVATDFSGNVYSAGIFTCVTVFEGDSLRNNSCGEIVPQDPPQEDAQVDAFVSKYDEHGDLLWVIQFEGSIDNTLSVNDISTDASGNCYVTGAFTGDLTIGTTAQFSNPDPTTEMFLVKVLADGAISWAVSYSLDDLSETAANKVAVTADAVYITGSIRGDFTVGTVTDSVGRNASFVASYDLAGTPLWTRHFMEVNANGASQGKAIEAQGDSIWVFSSFTDSVYIEGNVYRPPGAVPTVTAGVICLYNAAGMLQSHALTNTPLIEGIRLHRPDGHLYITGRAEGITAIGEDTLFTNAGARAYVSAHGLDLTAAGNLQWVTTLTAPSSAVLTTLGLDVDDGGNLYAAGIFDAASLQAPSHTITGGPGQNGFLLKLNNAGNDLWLQGYGSTGEDAVMDVSAGTSNRIFAAGYFERYIRVAGDEIETTVSNGMTARIDICPEVIADMITQDTTYICDREQALFEVTANGAYTYQWYKDALPVPGAGDATLAVTQKGIYYAEITAGGCSKLTPTAKLFINPLPDSVVLTNDPMEKCEGDVVKLSGPLGTYTFQWLDGGATIPETAKDISVSVDGDYQVRVTDALGCTILSDVFPVRFLPYPESTLTPAGGRYTLCSGDFLQLQADQSQPDMEWEWLKDDMPIAGAASATYDVTESGTYHAIVTNRAGCATVTEADTVVVQASPVVNLNDEILPEEICQGTVLRIVTPNISNQVYQWRKDGVDIPGATTNTLDIDTEGEYTVRVNNALCEKISDPFNLVVRPLPVAAIANPAPAAICEGDAFSLHAVEAPQYSYQWLSNNQPVAGAATPSLSVDKTGNYSVRITNSFNCQQTSPATTITVNLKPPATIRLLGPATFCEGGTVELLANAGTGLSYQWTRNGAPLNGSVNMSLETGESGQYEVQVTNANQCTSISDAVAVEVIAIPVAEVTSENGTTALCARDSLKLIAGTSAAYDFTWHFNGHPIGQSGASWYATAPGAYQVIAADGNCRDTSAVLQLVVKPNPLPVITRNEAFLSIAQFGDIQWYVNDEPVAGATQQIIQVAADGDYRVNVVNAEGCSAWSAILPVCLPLPEIQKVRDKLTVSIDAAAYAWKYGGLPIPGATMQQLTAQQSGEYSAVVVSKDGCAMETGPVTVCIPYPLVTQDEVTGVLLASPNPASGYQWYLGGSPISGATTQVHIPEAPGSYTVEIRDLEGCMSFSESFTITPVTGIEEGTTHQLRFYPNPAENVITIEKPAQAQMLYIRVTDVTGRELQRFQVTDNVHQLDVSQLTAGIYTLVVRSGVRTTTWKVVKK